MKRVNLELKTYLDVTFQLQSKVYLNMLLLMLLLAVDIHCSSQVCTLFVYSYSTSIKKYV